MDHAIDATEREMSRMQCIVAIATVLSVFTSLNAALYECWRSSISSLLKINPTLSNVFASLTVSVGSLAVVIAIGLLWWKVDQRRKERRIRVVCEWCVKQVMGLLKGMKTVRREVNIEILHYRDCRKYDKKYDWNRWDRLAEICDLVKMNSRLCNPDKNIDRDIERWMKTYPELWPVRELRETIVQGLDRAHQILNDRAVLDIIRIYEVGILIADVGDLHIQQLKSLVEEL